MKRESPPPQHLRPIVAAVAGVYGRMGGFLVVPWPVVAESAIAHRHRLFSFWRTRP